MKGLILISGEDHFQRFSPSSVSDTPQAKFEPVQNINSGVKCILKSYDLPCCQKHHFHKAAHFLASLDSVMREIYLCSLGHS